MINHPLVRYLSALQIQPQNIAAYARRVTSFVHDFD